MESDHKLEKGEHPAYNDPLAKDAFDVTETSTGEILPIGKSSSMWLRMRSIIRKLGAEESGIERIPESMRTDQSPRDLFTLWASANVGTATMAFGTLGPALFGLGWWDSFCCVLFFNLIGALPPALQSTLGPKLGLRTLTIQRFSFGYWPAKLIAFINLINMIGWAMVNTIAGADILYDVGDGKLPASVAVLIIGLVALIIGMFGYHLVHRFERPTEISGILSFGTGIIGFQISWASIAADYGVYMRETHKPWKVFLYSYMGLFLSQFLVELLGVALMLTVTNSDAFAAAYDARGVGGLTGQLFVGYGSGVRNFGKFIQAILSFSTIAAVITNIYSLGLNAQMVSDRLIKVPRLLWSFVGGGGAIVAAVAGRDHLQEVMEDFLNVVAYWLTPFLTIMFLEHILFRRGFAYDVSAWEDPKRLPYGIAAFTCWSIGTVLAILCMSQTWWVGPIALKVGNPPFGTDISWELALGATMIMYPPARWLERRLTGL
ncbi:hypothetical protein LTR56_003727 [Elasticomyces elasticus]|nr:hypothetical protein LTR56_003727 [Elasticomyces elasticus]KAK4928802.1 hypothetical protein LTR49_004611 [Elasticomyces elasticus]KAK5766572.1 hypothetical protein LTS12_003191 [Elasticomyces elasticus]